MMQSRAPFLCPILLICVQIVSTSIANPPRLQYSQELSASSLSDASHSPLDEALLHQPTAATCGDFCGSTSSKRNRDEGSEELSGRDVGGSNRLRIKKNRFASGGGHRAVDSTGHPTSKPLLSMPQVYSHSHTSHREDRADSTSYPRDEDTDYDRQADRSRLLDGKHDHRTRLVNQHVQTHQPYAMVFLQKLGLQWNEKTDLPKAPPYFTIDHDLADIYLAPYKDYHKALEHPSRLFSRSPNIVRFENIPVIRFLRKDSKESLIRVMTSEDPAGRAPASPKRIVYSLILLIKWILYNHEVFIRQVQRRKETGGKGVDDIIQWLWREFIGQDRGLPVVGMSENEPLSYTESAFSPVQKILIKQIYFEAPAASAYINSIGIIGMWYGKIKFEAWNYDFSDDREFWLHMLEETKIAIARARSSYALTKKLGQERPALACGYMGNLRIPEPKFILNTSKDPAFVMRQALQPSNPGVQLQTPQIERIKKRLEKFYTLRFMRHDRLKDFTGVLATVISLDSTSHDGRESFVIRLLKQTKEMLSHILVEEKLVRMMEHLQYHYTMLYQSLTALEKNEVGPNGDVQLFEWLEAEMFTTFEKSILGNKYALFGVYTEEISPRTMNAFGPVQKLLITYLTHRHERPDLANNLTAFGILGYWLKNKCDGLWNIKFQEDMKYWEYIIELIVASNYQCIKTKL